MATKKKIKIDLKHDKPVVEDLDQSMKQAFTNYGIAVASDRSVPNVLDGLKPVQRRILYAMTMAKLSPTAKFKKSQTVVGDVMGNWHPHGDNYGSVDYLTQNFVFPLAPIEGHGSFTDISGNPAAAARYTEVRLSRFGQLMVNDLSEKLVPYEDNYDNTKRMPRVFPAKLPYLLINGVKTGIAVGFTSSIAPHNPVDATRLLKQYIKTPKMTLDKAISILQGPDLPTGGTLYGDVRSYYKTGVGKFQNAGTIIDSDEDKNTLIITEVPYRMGGSINSYLDKVKDLIADGKLKPIRSIDDFTTDEDIANNKVRIEVTLQNNYDHEQAKTLLFQKTDLRQTYSLEWMALDGLTPKRYTLMQYLQTVANFQHTLVVREYKADLEKASARLEIVDGLIQVPDLIQAIVHAAQNTDGKADLMQVLQGLKTIPAQMASFSFTERQADAIASMRVYQLNRVDAQALVAEKADLEERIAMAKRYIEEPDLRVQLLSERLDEQIKALKKDGFGSRRTTLGDESELKAKVAKTVIINPVTITIDRYGYIKMTDKREVETDDEIQFVLQTTDDDWLEMFTADGRMLQVGLSSLKKYKARDNNRGDAAMAVFADNGYTGDDRVVLWTTRKHLDEAGTEIVMVSKRGLAKRFATAESKLTTKTLRKTVEAYPVKDGSDELLFVQLVSQTEIKNFDIIAIRSEEYKRIKLSAVKLQASAAGAGTQTFVDKKNSADLDAVYILNGPETDLLKVAGVQLRQLPVLRESQTFKKIQ